MKWITREKIKVDRVACPWLIRKFVDPEAEFVFLPRETDRAGIDNGIVFDVPNCELGHHGEDVSFNSILKNAMILAGFTHRFHGPNANARLVRGILLGSFSFAVFFLTIASMIERVSIVAAFACATAITITLHGASSLLLCRI
jgi:hypothetical protein